MQAVLAPYVERLSVYDVVGEPGRGGCVRDPEGNHWSFGSYQPR